MSESGFPDFLEFSSVNLTNIAGIVHCCGKIPADRKSFEIIKTLAIRRLHFYNEEKGFFARPIQYLIYPFMLVMVGLAGLVMTF